MLEVKARDSEDDEDGNSLPCCEGGSLKDRVTCVVTDSA